MVMSKITNFLKRIFGIYLLYLGVLTLAVTNVVGAEASNLPNIIGLVLVVAGAVGYVVSQKRRS